MVPIIRLPTPGAGRSRTGDRRRLDRAAVSARETQRPGTAARGRRDRVGHGSARRRLGASNIRAGIGSASAWALLRGLVVLWDRSRRRRRRDVIINTRRFGGCVPPSRFALCSGGSETAARHIADAIGDFGCTRRCIHIPLVPSVRPSLPCRGRLPVNHAQRESDAEAAWQHEHRNGCSTKPLTLPFLPSSLLGRLAT